RWKHRSASRRHVGLDDEAPARGRKSELASRDCLKTLSSEGRVTRVPDFFGDFRTIGDSCNSSLRSFETISSRPLCYLLSERCRPSMARRGASGCLIEALSAKTISNCCASAELITWWARCR